MSKYLTIDEVAAVLGIAGDDVREWISSGKVRATRRGGEMMVTQQAVQELMSNLPPEYEESRARYVKTLAGASGSGIASARPKERRAPVVSAGFLHPLSTEKNQPINRESSPLRGGFRSRTNPATGAPSMAGAPSITGAPSAGLAPKVAPQKEFSEPKLPAKGLCSLYDEERFSADGKALPSRAALRESKAGVPLAEGGDNAAKALERLLEPLARTQARIVRAVSELKANGADRHDGQLLASLETSIEKRLSQWKSAGAVSDAKKFETLQQQLEGYFAAFNRRLDELGQAAKADVKCDANAERWQQRCQVLQSENASLQDELNQLRIDLQHVEESERESAAKLAEALKSAEQRAQAELQAEAERSEREALRLRREWEGAAASQQETFQELEIASQQVAQLEQDKEALQSQLVEMDKLLKASQADLSRLQTERQESEKTDAECDSELDPVAWEGLQEQLRNSEEQNEQLQDTISQLEDELMDLRQALKERERANRRLAEEYSTHTDKMSELSDSIVELECTINERNVEIARLSAELSDKEAALSRANQRMQTCEKEAERLHRDDAGLRKEKHELEVQLRAKVSRLAELEHVIADHNAHQASLADTLVGLRRKNEELVNSVKELQGEQEQLQSSLQDKEAELQAVGKLQEELEAARKQIANFQNELARKDRDCAARLEDAKASLAADVEKAQAAAEQSEKNNRDLQESASKLEQERNRLLKRINTFQAKIQALRAELEEMREIQDVCLGQEEADALRAELAETRNNLEKARSENLRLKGERDSIEAQLNEYESQMGAIQEEYATQMGAMQAALEQRQVVVQNVTAAGPSESEMLAKLAQYEEESREKDLLIQAGSQDRANLRDELENSQRAYYELQQKFDRERREWSELLAKQIRTGDGGKEQPSGGGSAPLVGRLFKNRSSNRS